MLKRFVNYLNSKKNKVLLLGFISSITLNLFSQSIHEKLYFITGTIYVNIPPGAYYSYLLRYNNYTLDTVALLSNDSTQIKFIKAYHDLRKIVILKDGYIYNSNYILQVLQMDNPSESIGTYNMGDGNGLFEMNLVPYLDSLYYIFENSGTYLGVNISSLNSREFKNPEILTNAVIKGDVGGLMETSTCDYILLDHNKDGDSVSISISGNNYYFKFRIPDLLISKNKQYYALQTNNNNYMVIWNKSSDYNQVKNVGWSNIIILNKNDQQWNTLKLKGNIISIVNFKNWLAGWVIEGYDDNNGFKWISPGEKDRKKENNVMGSTFDERAEQLGVYMPGILYLYNMETKQYFEWNTGQGDSEILLVQDNDVYYRVADKIYKALIIDGKNIGLPELILKDEKVHDIHWAFISKK